MKGIVDVVAQYEASPGNLRPGEVQQHHQNVRCAPQNKIEVAEPHRKEGMIIGDRDEVEHDEVTGGEDDIAVWR